MGRFGTRIMPCPPQARAEGLAVLYRKLPEELRSRLVAEVLDEESRREIDLSGLWIARNRGGQVEGALLTQALAGKAVAVWAPEVIPLWRRGWLAASLVKAALADLKARGFRLAQAVLDESASPRAARDLINGGMPRVTELLYLERETTTSLPLTTEETRRPSTTPVPGPAPAFEWQAFETDREPQFRSVLQATYVGSLDMPELEGVRSLDDIMESHRATGRFDARYWQIGQIPGTPEAASVLLLSAVPTREAWEVVYLGLTPAARGRGLGRAVLAHALELASAHVPKIELAVDFRNTPATRLYQAAGFSPRDRRTVHLAIFRDDAG